MKKKLLLQSFLSLFAICSFFISDTQAANRYWVGNGDNKSWKAITNWSTTYKLMLLVNSFKN